jgi:hypothetical protein
VDLSYDRLLLNECSRCSGKNAKQQHWYDTGKPQTKRVPCATGTHRSETSRLQPLLGFRGKAIDQEIHSGQLCATRLGN